MKKPRKIAYVITGEGDRLTITLKPGGFLTFDKNTALKFAAAIVDQATRISDDRRN